MSTASRSHRLSLAAAAALTVAAAVAQLASAPEVLRFFISGLALAALAAVISENIEAVGEQVGPGATGLLQSTLGNLPELFVGIFALRDGLIDVVQSALVGSILGNALLVLGIAFVAGGLRHGRQRFNAEDPRLYGSLLILAVGAMLVPTLAFHLDTPAASHTKALSDVCAGVLLFVYACTVPFLLRRSDRPIEGENAAPTARAAKSVSLFAPVVLLVVASAGAAVVSSWFVDALAPATKALGISQAFAGLVIVALASNAVENVVGVRFALKAKPSYALSTTLASPLQVALLLTPALVLLSNVVGPTSMTLVFPALLVASLGVSAVVVLAVVYDGEYTWIEGVALIALYVMIATSFWWG